MLATQSNFNLDPTVGNTRRTNFLTGTKFIPQKRAIRDFILKPREFKRDNRFDRPAFIKSTPKPRGLKSIAEIERLKTKQEGIKVRLGDASLGKIKVKKRDKDGTVILDAVGEPVFEEVTLNFGLLSQMLEGSFKENMGKLVELETAIRTGSTKSQADRSAFAIALAQIMSKQDNVARMTATQLDFVTRSLQLLGISRDPVAAGIQDLVRGRFVTETTWERAGGRNKGPILLFLIANVRDNPRLSPNRPLFGRNGDPFQLSGIFPAMSGSSRQDPLVIDLIDKTMHNNLASAIASAQPAPVSFAQRFAGDVNLPLLPQAGERRRVPGVSIEEEDEQGVFRVISSLDPVDFAAGFQRQEGESTLERLARQSDEKELEAQQQLVPFGAAQPAAVQPTFQQLAQLDPQAAQRALAAVFAAQQPPS